jgi:hypothetical protein
VQAVIGVLRGQIALQLEEAQVTLTPVSHRQHAKHVRGLPLARQPLLSGGGRGHPLRRRRAGTSISRSSVSFGRFHLRTQRGERTRQPPIRHRWAQRQGQH